MRPNRSVSDRPRAARSAGLAPDTRLIGDHLTRGGATT